MSAKIKFQAIKGTRDLLPPETALWNGVEQTAHEVFATFGFGEIRLPVFESADLFARSIGLDTDVVSKEVYSFEDRPDARLERYKYILDRETTSFAMNAIRAHVHDLEIVLSDLRAASREGDVPDTTGNQRGLENLGILIGELAGHSAEKKLLSEGELARKLAAIQRIGRDLELADRVSLRPEATASVCRAYIQHNMQQLPQPVKLYYMGPMFRRERPQKGRYRQFYQIGAEVLDVIKPDVLELFKPGVQRDIRAQKELEKDAAVDAEVIDMLMTFFDRVGLQGTELSINSIGDKNCRPKYVELLRAELLKVKDKLGPDSHRRIETNPLRVLDSKLESEQGIIATLPRIADHLCEDCKTHYAAVKHQLEMRGVIYRENWRLVRGLDYYMRTTFEITAQGLGSQNAVCGGGRYDGLVELLGGPATKGIGFAIGEDRLILSLQESGKAPAQRGRDVYIAWMGERAQATAIRAAKDLRKAGFSVELPPVELKFGKALGQADKLGAKYALILGDNELASGEWTLKTLADGSQRKLREADLVDLLKSEKAKADPSLRSG